MRRASQDGSPLRPQKHSLTSTPICLLQTVPLAALIIGRDVALSISAFYFRYASLPAPVRLSATNEGYCVLTAPLFTSRRRLFSVTGTSRFLQLRFDQRQSPNTIRLFSSSWSAPPPLRPCFPTSCPTLSCVSSTSTLAPTYGLGLQALTYLAQVGGSRHYDRLGNELRAFAQRSQVPVNSNCCCSTARLQQCQRCRSLASLRTREADRMLGPEYIKLKRLRVRGMCITLHDSDQGSVRNREGLRLSRHTSPRKLGPRRLHRAGKGKDSSDADSAEAITRLSAYLPSRPANLGSFEQCRPPLSAPTWEGARSDQDPPKHPRMTRMQNRPACRGSGRRCY